MTGGGTLPFERYLSEVRTNTFGVDCTLSWPAVHTLGHRTPCEVGIKGSATYIPEGVAGDRMCIAGFVSTPFSRINKLVHPCSLSFQTGFGLGLYTRPKDFTGDPRNEFIGSCVNSVIEFGPTLVIPSCEDHAWVLGATFVHNSNGYIHKPNVGLNYFQAEVGWRFSPAGGKHKEHADTIHFHPRYDARTAPFITIAPGLTVPRHSLAGNDVFRPAYTVQLGYRCAYQPCRSLAFSLDMSYNFADDYECELTGKTPPVPFTLGASTMHETHWGPFSLRVGLGYYLWTSYPDRHVYERLGGYWHFGRDARYAVGIAIKAHVARADFIEWTWTYDLL